HVRSKRDHFGHLLAHLLGAAPGPANVDLRVAADCPTRLLQPLQEGGKPRLSLRIVRREVHEHADASHPAGRLLRVRRQRPCGYTAAEKCDEFPPPHGAYPKAKDHGLKYSRSRWLSGVHRNKKRRLMSAWGHSRHSLVGPHAP